tara:strand:+ start:1305 stop:1511 length:207 start_codon:yes stop_codon:yes gene_type:complete
MAEPILSVEPKVDLGEPREVPHVAADQVAKVAPVASVLILDKAAVAALADIQGMVVQAGILILMEVTV